MTFVNVDDRQQPRKTPHEAAFSRRISGLYSQYTTMYRPSQTTSTKCQYQAAPSKPK